jgi:hypothetical protein
VENFPISSACGLSGRLFFARLSFRPPFGCGLVCAHLNNISSRIICFGTKRVVNPASLGQPKTGIPAACYAVWDDGRMELRSFEYPLDETIRKIEEQPIAAGIESDTVLIVSIWHRTGPAKAVWV